MLSFAAFVTNSSFSWFYDPTALDKRADAIKQYAVSRTTAPRIIILGTSRAAFGLAPATIELELQQPALSVANWAYPGFGLEGFDLLVTAYQEQIVGAELVVLSIDPYFVLETKSGLPTDRFRFFERNWAIDIDRSLRNYLSTIVPVPTKMAWLFREIGGRLGLAHQFSLNWTMLPSGNWGSGGDHRSLAAVNAQAESDAIAVNYFSDKTVSATEVAKWKNFLPFLLSLNKRIMIVELPMAPSFVIAGQRYAYAIEQNRKVFEKLAISHRIRFIELTDVACGLGDDMFSDPVHTNKRGAEQLSQCFARMLKNQMAQKTR
jgi:hypothetical protein